MNCGEVSAARVWEERGRQEPGRRGGSRVRNEYDVFLYLSGSITIEVLFQ